MYDIVDYPEGGHKAVSITNLDGRPNQEYMLPCGPGQEMPSEYEQPKSLQRDSYKRAECHAGVKVSSDCDTLRNKLQWTKQWFCALSLFVAIFSLITLAAFSLAVYGFLNPQSSASTIPTKLGLNPFMENNTELNYNFEFTNAVASLETKLNITDQKALSLGKLVTTLETRLSETEKKVINFVSLPNIIAVLESRVNATDREIDELIPLKNSITSLQNELNINRASVLSLQNDLRSQPSKLCLVLWFLL